MMTPFPFLARQRAGGFTLVEAVIVIILTAIVSAGVALFIRMPVNSYINSAARADLVDAADTSLRRMARDLRLALPGSVRATTDASGAAYIELLLTRTGGRYLASEDSTTVGTPLVFGSPQTSFDAIGPLPTGEQQIQTGDSVVIYNQGQGNPPTEAYISSPTNRALITSVTSSAVGYTITIASPVYGNANSIPSPGHRFQVISGPVTYRCDPATQTLTRYWNYTIAATQPSSVAALTTGGSAQNALLANGVSACTFIYQNSTNTKYVTSGLASLSITMATPGNTQSSGQISLFQQVHVDNSP